MKRFAVFACDQYYPSGGMRDFKKSFDNEEEAEAFSITVKEDYVYVEDMEEYE